MPLYSFGKSKRQGLAIKNDIVGPGAYNSNNSTFATTKRKPAWRFGSARRSSLHKNDGPGPGAYQPHRKASSRAPDYSFGTRRHKSRRRSAHTLPGPGAYQHKSTITGVAFTMRPRTRDPDQGGAPPRVGPGSYDLRQGFNRSKVKCVFGHAKRFVFKPKNMNIGPGSYEVSHTRSNIKYSMRPKTSHGMRAKTPGPGQYFPNLSLIKSRGAMPVFSRDRKSRIDPELSRLSKVGPGSYAPKTGRNLPSYSFGRDKKLKADSGLKAPGPGQYDHKSFLESYPAYATWKIN